MEISISNPEFFSAISKKLIESNEIEVENFLCKEWNVYYNLHNPENFEDPDNSPEWYDSNDIYESYKKPKPSLLLIINRSGTKATNEQLKYLIENTVESEQKILESIREHTFGEGGAYAEAIHFQYAKKTIEKAEKTTYTDHEFLKRTIRIRSIELNNEDDSLKLYFHCSWNEEHGLTTHWKDKNNISIES